MIINRTFDTLIKMNANSFVYFLKFLKEFDFSSIEENYDKKYYGPDIHRIRSEFLNVFDSNKIEIEGFLKYQSESEDALVFMNRLLEGDSGKTLTLEVEMDFQYWQLLFEITDYFKSINDLEEIPDSNDWSPPDNFRDGTDDEKEIWDLYRKD
jgi:hypothetical protein